MYIKKLFEVAVICSKCQKERLDKLFYKHTGVCNGCIGREKLEKLKNEQVPRCKICRTQVENNRIKYCCPECRKIGTEKQKKEYWIRNIRFLKQEFNHAWGRVNLRRRERD